MHDIPVFSEFLGNFLETSGWLLLFKLWVKRDMIITTISSSVIRFSSCLQSFSASGSLLMSHIFTSGGQCTGSFSFSISPSNEYSGLISFRIDLFDRLAVQGILKSLLQHPISKAPILQHSAFFMIITVKE